MKYQYMKEKWNRPGEDFFLRRDEKGNVEFWSETGAKKWIFDNDYIKAFMGLDNDFRDTTEEEVLKITGEKK